MADAENRRELRPDERRAHARLPIITAVELRVGDALVHAVVSDASAGGMRLELAGTAARLFTAPTPAQVHELQVGVTFLQPGLQKLGMLQGAARWVRPTARGCSVGLQLLSESHEQLVAVLAVLQADETREALSRQRLGWAVVGLLLVGMAVMFMQHLSETTGLQQELSVARASLQDARASLRDAQDILAHQTQKIESLRDDINACQSHQVAPARWTDVRGSAAPDEATDDEEDAP